ncbi:MAG: putative cysteine cluster protein YcgN (CxxCxxCC family) [Halieaceae bacterium]
MAENKREVRTIEVTYLCDACGQGMMAKTGDMDPQTGDIEHRCMICDHVQIFKWQEYPRFEHIGLDEKA